MKSRLLSKTYFLYIAHMNCIYFRVPSLCIEIITSLLFNSNRIIVQKKVPFGWKVDYWMKHIFFTLHTWIAFILESLRKCRAAKKTIWISNAASPGPLTHYAWQGCSVFTSRIDLWRQQIYMIFDPSPYRRSFQIWPIFDPSLPKKCRRLKWTVPCVFWYWLKVGSHNFLSAMCLRLHF